MTFSDQISTVRPGQPVASSPNAAANCIELPLLKMPRASATSCRRYQVEHGIRRFSGATHLGPPRCAPRRARRLPSGQINRVEERTGVSLRNEQAMIGLHFSGLARGHDSAGAISESNESASHCEAFVRVRAHARDTPHKGWRIRSIRYVRCWNDHGAPRAAVRTRIPCQTKSRLVPARPRSRPAPCSFAPAAAVAGGRRWPRPTALRDARTDLFCSVASLLGSSTQHSVSH